MLIWTSNDGHFVSGGEAADCAAPPLRTGDPALCVCALKLCKCVLALFVINPPQGQDYQSFSETRER